MLHPHEGPFIYLKPLILDGFQAYELEAAASKAAKSRLHFTDISGIGVTGLRV